MQLYKKYLTQSEFSSMDDFMTNFEIKTPKNFNFAYDIIDEYARLEPQKTAIIWTNQDGEHIEINYQELKEKSDQAAAYFTSVGLGHDDKVMLVLMRRLEFWYSIIGLHKIGAVVIPATHLLTPKDIIYRSEAADIKAIIAVGSQEITKHVDGAISQCPTVKTICSVGPLYPEGWDNYQEKTANAAPFIATPTVAKNEDPSLLYFTSGTTGNPKMVIHNFLYPLGHIITASYWHCVKEGGVHLTVADTGWGKAVWGKLYGQMMAGCAVFVYDHQKFTPGDMLQVMADYHVTSFCAPPTVYRFMIKEDFAKYDLSALEYCTTAGEALNASVFDTFKERTGIMLMEAFGQTETVLQIGTFPWMKPKPGSMGAPSPLYDIALMKGDGALCEAGEQGEIVIKSERENPPIGLFSEYYRDKKLTDEAWYDGYYHTGDIAWADEDGYFWFVGRTDDVIKSSGYRIGPFEVESALMTHPAVVECAITGVPDPVRGQIVKATIVLNQGFTASDELKKEIQDHVKKVTAPYKYPRAIDFVEHLPKTISGKIRRVEIREKKD